MTHDPHAAGRRRLRQARGEPEPEIKRFDPSRVTLTFKGVDITGVADGTFIEVSPPLWRDNHVVMRPNDIEDHDPGDHDDGEEKAVRAYLRERGR